MLHFSHECVLSTYVLLNKKTDLCNVFDFLLRIGLFGICKNSYFFEFCITTHKILQRCRKIALLLVKCVRNLLLHKVQKRVRTCGFISYHQTFMHMKYGFWAKKPTFWTPMGLKWEIANAFKKMILALRRIF